MACTLGKRQVFIKGEIREVGEQVEGVFKPD